MRALAGALNQERLWRSTVDLAALTESDRPWTRRAFSSLFMDARDWLAQQFKEAGLSVQIDAAGNLIGRRQGAMKHLAPIVTGSHCDTVAHGGRYDGIIGVLAGLEIARHLHDNNIVLNHPFEIIDFLSEEPSDYGVSCVGSRAIGGALTTAMLLEKNQTGETLFQGIQRVGGQPELLDQWRRPADSVKAFIELHIEQGPVLEQLEIPIGIVTNIVGICRHRIVVTGRADHAGTTPMDIRRDALVQASKVVLAVQEKANTYLGGENYVVATIGHLNLTPNASNAVPGRVEMFLEVRSDSLAILEHFTDDLIEPFKTLIANAGLTLESTRVSLSNPTDCDPGLMTTIANVSNTLGYQHRNMPSGAGHDAVYMSKCGPIAMIFIPCKEGRSHCPEESITPEQLFNGTHLLYESILAIDRDVAV